MGRRYAWHRRRRVGGLRREVNGSRVERFVGHVAAEVGGGDATHTPPIGLPESIKFVSAWNATGREVAYPIDVFWIVRTRSPHDLHVVDVVEQLDARELTAWTTWEAPGVWSHMYRDGPLCFEARCRW